MHPSHGLAWSHTLWEHKMPQGHEFTLTCALIYPLNSTPVWLHAAPHTYQLVRDHSLEDWHTCTACGSISLHRRMRHRVNMPMQVHQAGQDCSILKICTHEAYYVSMLVKTSVYQCYPEHEQSEAQIRAEMITMALQYLSIDLIRYLQCLHCFKRRVAQAPCQPNAGLRCHNH